MMLVAFAALAGCGDDGGSEPDASVPLDGRTRSPDSSVPTDATMPADATMPVDATVTGDAATEYDVQFSTDLDAWSTLAKVTTDDTGKAVFTDAASAEELAQGTWVEATGFYRAVLVADDGGE